MKSFAIVCLLAFVSYCASEPFGDCPEVDGENPTYLPDLMENNVFYECSGGYPRMVFCPKGLIHDPNKNVCDFPSTECDPYGPIGVCVGNNRTLLRDGLNVAVYWECRQGEPVMGKCNNSMWFTPRYGGACLLRN